MLHMNRWWIGLVAAGLIAVLLGGCRPVVRPVVQPEGLAQAAYQAPEVLVHGAQIHSPNGIKAGPDGNLYVASVTEQAILVINPDTGEIVKRLGPEVGVDGPDDLPLGRTDRSTGPTSLRAASGGWRLTAVPAARWWRRG